MFIFRSLEILQLISNMLHFTEEQKIIVGLKVSPKLQLFPSLTSYISSFMKHSDALDEVVEPRTLEVVVQHHFAF